MILSAKEKCSKGNSFDWMDDFKSYICNSTVDVLSRFIDTYSIEDEAGSGDPDSRPDPSERSLQRGGFAL